MACSNSDALRAAYNACLPLLTAYHTELAQNARLYAAYQHVADTEYDGLARRTSASCVDNALRDFRLAGVALDAGTQAALRRADGAVATAQAKFDENVLDATNAWSRHGSTIRPSCPGCRRP